MATDPFHAVGVELEQVGAELSFAGRRLAAAFEATPSVGAGAGAGAGSSGRLDLDNLPQPVDIVHRVRALEARVPELREELAALAAKKQVRTAVLQCDTTRGRATAVVPTPMRVRIRCGCCVVVQRLAHAVS